VTRDGRRLLLFFNIEPIPRVKWPAAAGLAERGRRRRRWAEGALSAAELRDVFKARASSATRREDGEGGRRWVLVCLERRVRVGMRDKAADR
jgi:hypothetical protein